MSGATGYDVRAKSAGSSDWHDVASNVTTTSYRYTTTETIDYVAVRARNAHGPGNWTELSRLPKDDFMNVATGISVAGASVASAQSGASTQSQLAAPTGLTIARRVNRQTAEINLNLNWTNSTSPGATAYNIICSPGHNGWGWHACGWHDSGTVTYTSVPCTQTKPVKVTHYERKAGKPPSPPASTRWGRPAITMVNVRAVNANPSDASPWVDSGVIRVILPNLRDLTYGRVSAR